MYFGRCQSYLHMAQSREVRRDDKRYGALSIICDDLDMTGPAMVLNMPFELSRGAY